MPALYQLRRTGFQGSNLPSRIVMFVAGSLEAAVASSLFEENVPKAPLLPTKDHFRIPSKPSKDDLRDLRFLATLQTFQQGIPRLASRTTSGKTFRRDRDTSRTARSVGEIRCVDGITTKEVP